MRVLILAVMAAPLLAGCISAAKTVVTAPFKAVGQVADWSTTSQEESDRNRGREMRKREEQMGKLSRQRDKAAEKCRDGIYVLRMDDVLMVKRVARAPGQGRISVISDNPHYRSWDDLPMASVQLVGRVVWTGRRVR